MRKIIDYRVCYETDTTDTINNKVNSLIEKGWQPFGGVSGDNNRSQAMVKYEEVKTDKEMEEIHIEGMANCMEKQEATRRIVDLETEIASLKFLIKHDSLKRGSITKVSEVKPHKSESIHEPIDLTPQLQSMNRKLIGMESAHRNAAIIGLLLKGICTECLEELEPCYCARDVE